MSEITPSNTDAILGGQTPPPLNAAVLGGVAGRKQRSIYLAQELGLSYKLVDRLSQTHKIFSFETITVNERGEIVTRSKKQAFYYTENLGNDIAFDMVYIPAGSFMMGSDMQSDEQPIHQVNLKSFYMAKYPTTQAQYMAVVGKNPSGFKDDSRHPVECVLWEEAMEFCRRLSTVTGRKYTLPSESQWEYACRAGTITPFFCGKTITSEFANCNGYTDKNSKTTPVGKYPPNPWGLCDMHGNVCEWCLDNWHENYRGAPNDGGAWIDERIKDHTFRGGCWYYLSKYSSSSWRYYDILGSFHNNNDGFRLCSY